MACLHKEVTFVRALTSTCMAAARTQSHCYKGSNWHHSYRYKKSHCSSLRGSWVKSIYMVSAGRETKISPRVSIQHEALKHSCTATSVASEWVFSSVGNIISKKRSRAAEENAWMLICCHSNLAWSFHAFQNVTCEIKSSLYIVLDFLRVMGMPIGHRMTNY